ncbi:DUF1989 domain-containing protein [Rhizobium herbae]|uniref:Uncharacterized protein YcgI (DUF1989 family) n=1 Tax=Rhizobium herbae TaxID=508661 RepID=A0ABS4EPY8_9HYPH|nr:urea carboxylase-associated family protein [Rhizobium herbae]MBP1859998.1 uncharacterized protein YcgI (DUF1989 family) [Rhizobium herbae]
MGEYSDIVPAGEGRAYIMRAGQAAIITNTHGSQVVDLWAVSAEDANEVSSMDHTRSVASSIYFESGMSVVSNRRRRMLALVGDSAGLRHDTLLCPCNGELYQELGCEGYHRSCADNFHEAMSGSGREVPFTPASLNLFMNVPVNEDGRVERLPPASKAGDCVTLRAEMDILLVLSACPQDVTPINGAARTPMDVAVRILSKSSPEAV